MESKTTKMIQRVKYYVLIIVLIISCSKNENDHNCDVFLQEKPMNHTEEELKIIKAHLAEVLGSMKEVHIDSKIGDGSDEAFIWSKLDGRTKKFEQHEIGDYYEKNRIEGVWGGFLNTRIRLITDEEQRCIFEKDSQWESFYDKYPNSIGIMTSSRPIISENGDYALFEIEYYCGHECGEGHIVIMRKEEVTWRTEIRIPTWAI